MLSLILWECCLAYCVNKAFSVWMHDCATVSFQYRFQGPRRKRTQLTKEQLRNPEFYKMFTQLQSSLVLLLVSVICSECAVERETVSGSFSDTAAYSYPLDLEDGSEDHECGFPWGQRSNKTGNCSCGARLHDTVFCSINYTDIRATKVGILDCSCMTWDDYHNTTVTGYCFYNCENGSTSNGNRINRVYHPINNSSLQIEPRNLSRAVCGYLNREGRLCGRCASGYYPPAYSYSLKCVTCRNEWYNWLRFMAEAFGPLTVFLVIVLLFRISATSAQLSAYVLFCQNLSIPSSVYVILKATSKNPFMFVITKILVTLYSIWNLDFFRSVYPPVCLHVSSMQLVLLEYCIAFYPLLLLLLIYMAAKLRMYQIRGIHCLWVPVNSTMSSLRRTWNFKTSVIHSFATFLLLSYSKLLSISFHSIIFTRIHNARGTFLGSYVYYDPSLKYFGPEHMFYGLLALVIFTIFVVAPVVLMFVYPMRWFQRTLTRLHLNREVVRSFMEAFQGCYKDGTNNTRDCRYFSGVYLLVRIVLFTLYSITLTSLFYTFATILFISMAILLVTIRPYKERYAVYNKVDAIMILIQALSTSSILCKIFADIKGERFKTFSMFLVAFFAIAPLLYVVAITGHWAYSNKKLRGLARRLKSRMIERSLRSSGEKEQLLDSSQQTLYGSINN